MSSTQLEPTSTIINSQDGSTAKSGRLFRGHEQPPINERLEKARIYLADEDIRRDMKFKDRFEQIEELLQLLKEKKANPPYQHDATLYREVKVMVEVHKDWMARTGPPNQDLVSFELPPLQQHSNRLMSQQTAAQLRAEKEAAGLTAMREDHPPFTVHRDIDHLAFVEKYYKHFGSDPLTIDPKKNLMLVEGAAYIQSLNNPKTIPYKIAKLNKNQESTEEEKFLAMAQRRGIQRASVELALTYMAGNFEQKRPQDRFRRLEIPAPWTPPLKEVPLSIPLKPTHRPLELDPFAYTKIMLEWRRSMQWDYNVSRDNLGLSTSKFKPQSIAPPINWKGPYIHVDDEEIEEREKFEITKARKEELINVVTKLMDAEKRYPRPFIRRVIECIVNTIKDDSEAKREHLRSLDSEFDERYVNLLLALADPPTNEHAGVTTESSNEDWEAYWERADMPEAADFARIMMGFEHDLPILIPADKTDNQAIPAQFSWPNGTIQASGMALKVVNKLFQDEKIRKSGANNLGVTQSSLDSLTDDDMKKFLVKMDDEGFIIYDQGNATISRNVQYPETNYAVSKEEEAELPEFGTRLQDYCGKLDWTGIITKTDFFQLIAQMLGGLIQSFQNEDEYLNLRVRLRQQTTGIRAVEEGMESAELYKNLRKISEDADEAWEEPERPIPLREHANQLNAIAPDLFKEIQINENPHLAPQTYLIRPFESNTISDKECAKIIQMQLLEEANNNWDLKFPEHENVWGFAAKRLSVTRSPNYVRPKGKALVPFTRAIKRARDQIQTFKENLVAGNDARDYDTYKEITRLEARIVDLQDLAGKPKLKKQFFSMLRWPLRAQSIERQAKISASGPLIQPKPAPVRKPRAETPEEIQEDILKRSSREKWFGRGQKPFFPFGETPYQQAYLSWRMQQDLKDVTEFMDRDSEGNLITADGWLVDKDMSLINVKGQHVDKDMQPVDIPIKYEPPEEVLDPPTIVICTHACTNACPEHCPDSGTPKRNPFELPKLPDNWKPKSIPQAGAVLQATDAIYDDADLFQEVGPDAPAHDQNVFGPQGEAHIAWRRMLDEAEKNKRPKERRQQLDAKAKVLLTDPAEPEESGDEQVPEMSEKVRGKQPAGPTLRDLPGKKGVKLTSGEKTATKPSSPTQSKAGTSSAKGRGKRPADDHDPDSNEPARKRTRITKLVKTDKERKVEEEADGEENEEAESFNIRIQGLRVTRAEVPSRSTVGGVRSSRLRALSQRNKGRGMKVTDGGHIKDDSEESYEQDE